MNDAEIKYAIALSRLPKVSLNAARLVYDKLGSATAVWENHLNIQDALPDASKRLIDALRGMDEAVKRAETELEFITKKNIKVLCIGDSNYPARLLECNDAPLVLFTLGDADFNAKHVISIVGTRHATQYGRDICQSIVAGIQKACPDTLIVSGLAYGIDINAHRAALSCGLPTVGVLAHGLDRIYPSAHRQTAVQMLSQGGLLTEYISGTTPERLNFVSRNRIVAGISDATLVVESAQKGGSLITAELAQTYNRDVFAVPGRITDEYSIGCNRLISDQRATLVQSADDILTALGWATPQSVPQAIQQELFPDLNAEQQLIVDALRNTDGKQINQIIVETGLSYSQVSNQLYELECMGVITLLGGARYKLVFRSH